MRFPQRNFHMVYLLKTEFFEQSYLKQTEAGKDDILIGGQVSILFKYIFHKILLVTFQFFAFLSLVLSTTSLTMRKNKIIKIQASFSTYYITWLCYESNFIELNLLYFNKIEFISFTNQFYSLEIISKIIILINFLMNYFLKYIKKYINLITNYIFIVS